MVELRDIFYHHNQTGRIAQALPLGRHVTCIHEASAMDAAADGAEHLEIHTSRSNGAALVLSGLALSCLGAIVIWFSANGVGVRHDRELLLAIGVAVTAAGLGFASLGARPRRHWLACGALELSRPWALGRPRIAWREIGAIGLSFWGGVWVGTADRRVRLRITREVEDFERIVDVLCDALNENLGAPKRRCWRGSSGLDSVRLTDATLNVATADGEWRVHWHELHSAFLDTDARLRPAIVLLLKSGERLLVPHVGGEGTLELYRAIRAQTSVSQLVRM